MSDTSELLCGDGCGGVVAADGEEGAMMVRPGRQAISSVIAPGISHVL
jgi:hypothetical protein